MKRIVLFIMTLIFLSWLTSVCVFAYTYNEYGYSYGYDYDYDYDDYYSYEEEEYSAEFAYGKNVLISLVIGLVISLIITGVMRSKMRSVRFENAARNYIRQNSMNITRSHDRYLYSHVTKVAKPQKNNRKR